MRSVKRAGNRYWPEPKGPREVVLSRVETDEDRAKKALGESDESINDWLSLEPEEEFKFERTLQYIREHPEEFKKPDAGAKVSGKAGQPEGTPQPPKSKTGRPDKGPASNAPAKEHLRHGRRIVLEAMRFAANDEVIGPFLEKYDSLSEQDRKSASFEIIGLSARVNLNHLFPDRPALLSPATAPIRAA